MTQSNLMVSMSTSSHPVRSAKMNVCTFVLGIRPCMEFSREILPRVWSGPRPRSLRPSLPADRSLSSQDPPNPLWGQVGPCHGTMLVAISLQNFPCKFTFQILAITVKMPKHSKFVSTRDGFRTKPAWMQQQQQQQPHQQQPFGYPAWPGMTPFGYPPTPPPHMMQPPVYYPPPFCAPGWGAPPPPPQVQQPCFGEDDSYSSEDDRPTGRRAPTPPAREKKRRNRNRQCDDDEDDSSFPPRKPERPVDLTQPEKDGDEKSKQSGSEQKKRNTSSSSGLDKKVKSERRRLYCTECNSLNSGWSAWGHFYCRRCWVLWEWTSSY